MRKAWLIAGLVAALAVAGPAAARDLDIFDVFDYYIHVDDDDESAKVRQPAAQFIKPSQALRIAMGVAPQAKPLGVQLRGALYIVKLKQGNRVIKVRVDAGTGAIQ